MANLRHDTAPGPTGGATRCGGTGQERKAAARMHTTTIGTRGRSGWTSAVKRAAAVLGVALAAAMLGPENAAAQNVPSAPRNLTATSVDSTTIQLDWDAPTTTNGNLTGYRIQYNDGTGWQLLSDTTTRIGATVRFFEDTSVPENGTRSYRVRAVNANGTGPASNVATATAMDPEMVLVEAHFQEDFVFLTFSSAIDITLTQPRKTAFKINVEGRSHIGIKSILYPADLTEPNIATVVIETTHDLRPGDVVRLSYTKPSTNPLTDTFGVEADGFTNVLARNTIPAKEPDAPPNFRANSGAVDGSVSLTWDEAWWNGSAITRYEVRVDNGSWRTVPGGGSARSHTVTGLVVGSERTFRVRAVNGEGSSEASSVTFTVTESKLEFTLTLIEEGIWRGGPATTAVLAIKGHHYWNRLPEPITFDLTWNGNPVNEAPLHPDNPTSMTIPAGEHLARVELRAVADSDGADRVYNRPVTHRLVATSSDGVFVVENRSPSKGPRGLTIVDNEKKPRVSLQGPEIVDEGEHFRLTVRFSHRLDQDAEIRGSVINGARHSWNLTGIRDSFGLTIPKGELTATSGQIRKPQNTRKDGDKTVTFLVKQPGDNPWLGTPLHEVRINDDETPDADRWQRLSVDDASVHREVVS